MTPVELDELTLQESHFLHDDSFIHTGDTTNLPQYISDAIGDWSEISRLSKPSKKGAPFLIIVTPSAKRAVDLIRAMSEMKGKSVVAKLFAKHFKLEEQGGFLKSHVCDIGVGTPHRIHKLVEQGSLQLKQLLYLVIDWTWQDAKQRTISSIPEVCNDLCQLLHHDIIPRVKEGHVTIGLF
jgi:protein CMS1